MSFLRADLRDDDVQAVRDENLDLKRRLNIQMDLTKRLTTRVQKMSDDMNKLKLRGPVGPVQATKDHEHTSTSASGIPAPVIATRAVFHKRHPSLEALVDDLRLQVRDLAKDNSLLKSKVQHYKATHESNLRKKGMWDSIGPRKGARKSPVKKEQVSLQRIADPELPPAVVPPSFHDSEEYHQMSETVHMLQGELDAKNDELSELRRVVEELQKKQPSPPPAATVDMTEHLQLKQTVAVLEARQKSLTLELTNKTRMIEDLLQQSGAMEEKEAETRQRNAELTQEIEHHSVQLQEARDKVVELETQLVHAQVDLQHVDHLQKVNADIKTELDRAHEENARLVEQALVTEKTQRARFDAAAQDLAHQLAHLESSNKQLLLDNKRLLDDLDLAKAQTATMTARHAETQHQLDRETREHTALRNRVALFAETNHVAMGDLQEALVIISWRRQHHVSLDTLLSMHEWMEDKAAMLHLRSEYLQALQDLDKTRQLLSLQQQVNRDYKHELAQVHGDIERLRDEYAVQRERDARLLDARQHRIGVLERQVRHLSAVSGPARGLVAAADPSRHGPCLVLKIHQIQLAKPCTAPQLLLFAVDFFTFETQVTPPLPPSHQTFIADDWTVSWPLDPLPDALFWYLEADGGDVAIDVVVVRSDGTFKTLVTARVTHLAQLLHAGSNGLFYNLELYGAPAFEGEEQYRADGSDQLLGTLQCSLAISLPLEEAWLAYQERSGHLRQQAASAQKRIDMPPPGPQYRSDTLHVSLTGISVTPKTKNPRLYGLVDVYHRTGLRIACPGFAAPDDPETVDVPLVLSPDVVQWIEHKPMVVSVFDDADPSDYSSFLGQAHVALAAVAQGDEGSVEAELVLSGQKVGSVTVKLGWRQGGPRAAGDDNEGMGASRGQLDDVGRAPQAASAASLPRASSDYSTEPRQLGRSRSHVMNGSSSRAASVAELVPSRQLSGSSLPRTGSAPPLSHSGSNLAELSDSRGDVQASRTDMTNSAPLSARVSLSQADLTPSLSRGNSAPLSFSQDVGDAAAPPPLSREHSAPALSRTGSHHDLPLSRHASTRSLRRDPSQPVLSSTHLADPMRSRSRSNLSQEITTDVLGDLPPPRMGMSKASSYQTTEQLLTCEGSRTSLAGADVLPLSRQDSVRSDAGVSRHGSTRSIQGIGSAAALDEPIASRRASQDGATLPVASNASMVARSTSRVGLQAKMDEGGALPASLPLSRSGSARGSGMMSAGDGVGLPLSRSGSQLSRAQWTSQGGELPASGTGSMRGSRQSVLAQDMDALPPLMPASARGSGLVGMGNDDAAPLPLSRAGSQSLRVQWSSQGEQLPVSGAGSQYGSRHSALADAALPTGDDQALPMSGSNLHLDTTQGSQIFQDDDPSATADHDDDLYALLSPTIHDADLAEIDLLADDHVTLVLHTLQVHANSAVVQDHLAGYQQVIVAFDVFGPTVEDGDAGSMLETTAQFVRYAPDDDTPDQDGALVPLIDLGFVASFPSAAPAENDDVGADPKWAALLTPVVAGMARRTSLSRHASLAASGSLQRIASTRSVAAPADAPSVTTTLIVAVSTGAPVGGSDESGDEPNAEFVDVASAQLDWAVLVRKVLAPAPGALNRILVPLDVEFLDGVGSLGTLVVEVHGLAPLLARLGMQMRSLAASRMSLPGSNGGSFVAEQTIDEDEGEVE
ncbi:X-linked retinitis pigmentosa GTPase regulator-interacting protein 1 [Allomyces javanicus]|nr:X-linked retinitis pigmentosa GTPase regulator-interacting protein 1 [Allomyces javanicus]